MIQKLYRGAIKILFRIKGVSRLHKIMYCMKKISSFYYYLHELQIKNVLQNIYNLIHRLQNKKLLFPHNTIYFHVKTTP